MMIEELERDFYLASTWLQSSSSMMVVKREGLSMVMLGFSVTICGLSLIIWAVKAYQNAQCGMQYN